MPADRESKPRTFVVPPENFDPLSATPNQLRRHGFPQRPSDQAPEAQKLWNKWMAMYRDFQFEYVVPRFEPLPKEHTIQAMRPTQKAIAKDMPPNTAPWPVTLGDYSGIALFQVDPIDRLQSITAKFIIPNFHPAVVPDQTGMDGWVYCWVGIDGLTLLGGSPQPASDLLAVGSATTFIDGTRDCYLWYAWYANNEVSSWAQRLNMPASPGDTVVVSACSDEKGTWPQVIISNLNTRQ
jgi:hypothetical protein